MKEGGGRIHRVDLSLAYCPPLTICPFTIVIRKGKRERSSIAYFVTCRREKGKKKGVRPDKEKKRERGGEYLISAKT